ADAAEGLPELLHDGLGAVVLYHLSQTNNLPALAATVVAETLDRCRAPVELVVTHQDRPTAWVEVG
ncbi:MAG TPA: hypothetical protein VMT16_15320, partial [Thermoanaerobaculia bacterium]|nr:hypothetical protein [Thermoanaerobaculia bacterium]